jgi:hypothetical protein
MSLEVLEAYKKAYREVVKEEARRSFIIHLVIYIVTNLALAAINLLYSSKTLWFIYPLFFWGIGVAMHYLFAVKFIDSFLERREALAEKRMK